MCGPSGAQENIAGQTASLASTLSANYNKNFAAQAGVLQNLNNIFTPIAQAGPDQQGFGPQELAALSTAAGEGVGTNYSKASQALNNQLAVRGGGSEALPTGARAALQGQLASAAANASSQAKLGIVKANYDTGRSQWQSATAGLNALANAYNPNAIAGEAGGTLNSAFGDATQIQNMKNQEQAEIAGGITSLAMDAATFGAGAFAGGGFSGAGGLKALATGGKSLMG